jgi:hypothetical protein
MQGFQQANLQHILVDDSASGNQIFRQSSRKSPVFGRRFSVMGPELSLKCTAWCIICLRFSCSFLPRYLLISFYLSGLSLQQSPNQRTCQGAFVAFLCNATHDSKNEPNCTRNLGGAMMVQSDGFRRRWHDITLPRSAAMVVESIRSNGWGIVTFLSGLCLILPLAKGFGVQSCSKVKTLSARCHQCALWKITASPSPTVLHESISQISPLPQLSDAQVCQNDRRFQLAK